MQRRPPLARPRRPLRLTTPGRAADGSLAWRVAVVFLVDVGEVALVGEAGAGGQMCEAGHCAKT